jgi:glycerol-3-phosphate dehydrogenase
LHRALFAPSGGIVDVPALCESLLSESGASVLCGHRVNTIEYDGSRWRIHTDQQDFRAEYLINAAGLYADEISKMAGYPDYTIYPCSGEYYEIDSWTSPHLYYPAPHSGTGLGIHLTPTLRGTTLIGPTAAYLQSKTDQRRFFEQKDFTNAAELLYPGCTKHPVHIAHRGTRPRLTQNGFSDFVIKKEEKPLIQLIGIESPGLTSCLSIANHVRGLLTG